MNPEDEVPHWSCDPYVNTAAHELRLLPCRRDRGRRWVAACSCGNMSTPPWGSDCITAAYDLHMGQVQTAAHGARAVGLLVLAGGVPPADVVHAMFNASTAQ